MKKTLIIITTSILTLLISASSFGQNNYEYYNVPGDPLEARIYTLDNGLKVYLSVYKNDPRIQTSIAVRSGGMNDPADNTGLSHYLEHLMFKGTDRFGTLDWEKEKYYLNIIDSLYEFHSKLTDDKKRSDVYAIIDSVSYEASKYAIPNEYDRLLGILGARGTNAYTSLDETVYINDIPANQIERWLTIEAERFRNPIFRIFHTELETVYEEKNMSLDNDSRKIGEAYLNALYPNHPYGTQTVLGSQEHLKNPSIRAIRDYYNRRYVPNNMAIIMSGDFDPDVVINLIDKHFGYMEPKTLDDYSFPSQPEINEPIIREVLGPQAESVNVAFRFPGAGTHEHEMLSIVNMLLFNRTAGLIDLNINQAQKALGVGSWVYNKSEYSTHVFSGTPKQDQSLEEVKDLMLNEIENIKTGNFDDWMLSAVINNLKISEIRGLQSNQGRNRAMVNSFTKDINWEDYVNRFERLEKITKQDIVDFANNHYRNNYAVVYKRQGRDDNIIKVDKPQITPVVINRDVQSDFFTMITEMDFENIEPVFIDYQNDIQKYSLLNDNIPLLYQENEENELFTLYYVLEMGNNHDQLLSMALNYLQYLGTDKHTPAEISQEFYKLGSSFNVSSADDRTYVFLSGIEGAFEQSLRLFEHLLDSCSPNEEALENLKRDIIRQRENQKLNKSSVFWSALYNYGLYGNNSPVLRQLSNEDLMDVSSDKLIERIKSITSYEHSVLYYGVKSPENLIESLEKHRIVPGVFASLPEEDFFDVLEREERNVFVVNYDMQQVDLLLFSKATDFNKEIYSHINLFNEYFGSGMSSIVFQELREAKGLAYSAFARFTTPARTDRSHVISSFIGTQNDKLEDALSAMNDLLENMPVSESHFFAAKETVLERIRTQRITRTSILFNYLNAQKLEYNYDRRKDIFEQAPGITLENLKSFHSDFVKGHEFDLLVIGKVDALDMDVLNKFGKVQVLSLEEIFGY